MENEIFNMEIVENIAVDNVETDTNVIFDDTNVDIDADAENVVISQEDIVNALRELLQSEDIENSATLSENALDDSQDHDESVDELTEVSTDYSQYIYDYLTDSDVNVNVTNSEIGFLDKPIIDYTVNEGILLCIFLVIVGAGIFHFITHNVFKWG